MKSKWSHDLQSLTKLSCIRIVIAVTILYYLYGILTMYRWYQP